MRPRALLRSAAAFLAVACAACGGGGAPPVEPAVAAPDTILDFTVLYRTNCAGCHGPNGDGGVALGLGNPVYLAMADDVTVRRVTAQGVAGTAMPAFARSAGGLLTDPQIDAIVTGIRARWASPRAIEGAPPPSYASARPGDAARGAAAYGRFCASCHGAAARGGPRAGSIVEGAYLALVSDQHLRTTIIAGRPDLGHPDWRGDLPGTPLSSDNVADIVAWLAARRPPADGASAPPMPKDTP